MPIGSARRETALIGEASREAMARGIYGQNDQANQHLALNEVEHLLIFQMVLKRSRRGGANEGSMANVWYESIDGIACSRRRLLSSK